MTELSYVSLFSGIEAFSVAASRVEGLRWNPVFFSEIEPFPCAVLAHHFPTVPNLGDITKIRITNEPNARTLVATNGRTTVALPRNGIDLLAGGSPCQDVSVAGKRAGMAKDSGSRSALAFEYARLVKELRPRVILWENVPGVLSSNRGLDFAAFLCTLGELGYCCAYRVLDCQYTRVDGFQRAIPQRRRRVWLVGCLGGDGRAAAQILFERAGVLGDTPPRRETGQGFAAPPGYCAQGDDRVVGGAGNVCFDRQKRNPPIFGDGGASRTLSHHTVIDAGMEDLVVSPSSSCLTPGHPQTHRVYRADGASYTLNAGERSGQDQRAVLVSNSNGGQIVCAVELVVAPAVCKTLSAEGYDGMPDPAKGNGMPVVAIDMDKCKPSRADSDRRGGSGMGVNDSGASYTIEAREGASKMQAVAVGFCPEASAKTRSVGFKPGQSGREDTGSLGARIEVCPTLPRDPGGMGVGVAIAPQYIVRRLTPTECERLQGFPDNWTLIPYRHKPAEKCPDSPRYKALGNSWATNCAEWILRRIVAAFRLGMI